MGGATVVGPTGVAVVARALRHQRHQGMVGDYRVIEVPAS